MKNKLYIVSFLLLLFNLSIKSMMPEDVLGQNHQAVLQDVEREVLALQPTQLNDLAIALILQHKLVANVFGYAQGIRDKRDSAQSFGTQVQVHEIHSYENLSLAFYYREIFSAFILSVALEQQYAEGSGDIDTVLNKRQERLVTNPLTYRVIKKCKECNNPEIKQFGKIIENNMLRRLRRQRLEKNNDLVLDTLLIYRNKEFNHIRTFVESATGRIAQCVRFIKSCDYACLSYNKVQGDLATFLENQILSLADDVVAEYQVCTGFYSELYTFVYKRLQDLQKLNKTKLSLLKFRKNKTIKEDLMYTVAPNFVQGESLPIELGPFKVETVQLPYQDVDFDVLDDAASSQDDFLPDHLKKPRAAKKAQQKKVQPKSAKKAAGKAQKAALAQPQKKQIEQLVVALDGSSLKQQTEEFIEFNDPKNDSVVRIIKSDNQSKPKQLKGLQCTDWANAWYEDPQTALENQGYKEVGSKKFTRPEDYAQTVAYHAIPKIIFDYVHDWADQRSIPSRRNPNKLDHLIVMPAVVFYNNRMTHDNRNWESGVIGIIVDSSDNKTVYHVEFRPVALSKMVDDYWRKGFFEVSFPSLQEISEYEARK